MAESNETKHAFLAMTAIILGGITALVFGFAYIGKSIYDPLRLKTRTVKTLDEIETQKMAELRLKDTDADGLTDYDEIYVWKTSAYLADTDSDGFDDKKEIESGNDPNCPAGKNCGAIANAGTVEGSGATTDPLSLIPPEAAKALFPSNTGGFGSFNEMLTSLPPDEIRKLLIANGVPKETLDTLDDATLVALYESSVKESLLKLQKESEAAGNSTTESGTPSASEPVPSGQ